MEARVEEVKLNGSEIKEAIKKLKPFFKKAAEEVVKDEPGNISASDFFKSQETPEDKSVHAKWLAYVGTVKRNECKETEERWCQTPMALA